MDCGIPYCHNGCPVNNQIPDWNDLVYQGNWEELAQPALDQQFPRIHRPHLSGAVRGFLHAQHRGRAGDDQDDRMRHRRHAWQKGWIVPEPPAKKTGKRVAVIGSGPAGLAAAQQLARAGHDVNVYEKNAKPGGLLRYGIPDFKMEKHLIDRRIEQMRAEGVEFHSAACRPRCHPWRDPRRPRRRADRRRRRKGARSADRRPRSCRHSLRHGFPAAAEPSRLRDEPPADKHPILANGKHVVVIGGGDTGSDCIGTSIRHGALSVTQLEIMPRPPEKEDKALTWPNWPLKLRTSSRHQEGAEREFSVMTSRFTGENGAVR